MANFTRPERLKQVEYSKKHSLLSFPSTPLPHGILLLFKEYDYAAVGGEGGDDYNSLTSGLFAGLSGGTDKPPPSNVSSIELPFPKTLTDQHGIKVNGFERSFLSERLSSFAASALGGSIAEGGDRVAGAVSDAAGMGKDVLSKLKTIGERLNTDPSGVKEDLRSLLGSSGQQAKQVMTYLLQNYSGDIGRAMSAATGAAINPNETLAFEGVDLKTFSFTWDLFPENEQDSENIKKIVQLIRQNILPDYGAFEGLSVERALLTYPSVCFIELLGVDNSHWPKFKPCLVSNVSLDYGAGGMIGILKGGRPVAVQLQMTFNELTIHTRQDYPGDTATAPQAEAENQAESPKG